MFSIVMKCLKPIVPVLQVSKLQVSKLKFHKGRTQFINIVKQKGMHSCTVTGLQNHYTVR